MSSTPKGSHGGMADFNIHHGFIEALIRGMRSSFLSEADYHHITQCENLEDVKLNMSETDYADAVADMSVMTPSVLQTAAINKVSSISKLRFTSYFALSWVVAFVSNSYYFNKSITLILI